MPGDFVRDVLTLQMSGWVIHAQDQPGWGLRLVHHPEFDASLILWRPATFVEAHAGRAARGRAIVDLPEPIFPLSEEIAQSHGLQKTACRWSQIPWPLPCPFPCRFCTGSFASNHCCSGMKLDVNRPITGVC
jgi:hypothetical protein